MVEHTQPRAPWIEDFCKRFPIQGTVPCGFGCSEEACGIFYAPGGCICKEDELQALCMQHAIKAEQNGVDIRVICWLKGGSNG